MPWTEAARREYRREARRYASDLTTQEWVLIAPFMPPPKRVGRPRTANLREVMNAILYIATTGCQWAQLPKDLPPYATAQRYFYDWRDSGLLQTMRFMLAMQTRELEGREAQPTAGVIDSQSTKPTESGGVCGYGETGPWPRRGRVSPSNGKKVKGRKRHIVVDTIGVMFGLVVHAADVQDRDAAPAVLASIRRTCPWLRHVFADGGYAGPKLRGALDKIGEWTIEIIKRSDTAQGFEVLPRRWVVERTFAWLGRCRRLAKDWEKSIASAEAWINVAHIRLTTRRIARYCYVS